MGDYPPHAGTFAALVLRENTHAYILWGEVRVACDQGEGLRLLYLYTCSLPVPVADQGEDVGTSSRGTATVPVTCTGCTPLVGASALRAGLRPPL